MISYPPTHWNGRYPIRATSDGKLIPFTNARNQRPRAVPRQKNPTQGQVVPWPRQRVTEVAQAGRRQRKRPTVAERWMPTVLFGLLVGGMIFLFAVLRILAQPPEPAQSAGAPAIEAPIAPVIVEVLAAPPDPAPVPGRTVTRQGNITLTVQQVEPTYAVVSGDSLSSIAQRTGTTAEAVQSINNLPDSFLRVGQRLVLP